MTEASTPERVSAPSRIAPTEVTKATKCLLAFALDRCVPENQMALPSASPLRYLGTAFHRLIEGARRGDAGDPVETRQLERLWSTGLSEVEAEAARNGDEVWLPLRESAPTTERIRLAAIRLASAQTVYSGSTKRGTSGGKTEAWLRSEDGMLAGKVDALDGDQNHVDLQDFKSGSVLDENAEIKPEASTQLKMYAALYYESRGSWPGSLTLIDRYGRRTRVDFTHEECLRMAAEARALLVRAQTSLANGGRLSDRSVADLADPSGGACATCRHRPVCPRYLARLAEDGLVVHGDSRYPQVDLMGALVEEASARGGGQSLRLAHRERIRSVQRVISDTGFEEGQADPSPPEKARPVAAVFGALPRRAMTDDANHFVASRSMRVYTVPAGSAAAQLVAKLTRATTS